MTAVQFSEILALPWQGKKIQDSHMVCWQNFLTENCQSIESFQFFCNFSEDVALPAQDMLHTEICTCDGNAIIFKVNSQGYVALRLEKFFKKFYGRYKDLIEKYQRSVRAMVKD